VATDQRGLVHLAERYLGLDIFEFNHA
jgi:hypothetical protein